MNVEHEIGGPKARGFERTLGIKPADVEYLVEALLGGIREAPITEVRDNAPFGLLCEVRLPIAGLRKHRDRVVALRTVWELRHADDRPRLVTAYIDG